MSKWMVLVLPAGVQELLGIGLCVTIVYLRYIALFMRRSCFQMYYTHTHCKT